MIEMKGRELPGDGADAGAGAGEKIGGDEGIRTPDPLLAKQVLSQLSYAPTAGYWLPVAAGR